MKGGAPFTPGDVASSANITDVTYTAREVVETGATAAGTPTPIDTLPLTESMPITSPFSHGGDMGASSIDLSQVLGAHPGVCFLLGCIFIVTILMLLEYRRR